MTQYFTIDFICAYDMIRYPFDSQTCRGSLFPKGNSEFFVDIVPGNITYTGPTNLMKYVLEKNVSFIHQVD